MELLAKLDPFRTPYFPTILLNLLTKECIQRIQHYRSYKCFLDNLYLALNCCQLKSGKMVFSLQTENFLALKTTQPSVVAELSCQLLSPLRPNSTLASWNITENSTSGCRRIRLLQVSGSSRNFSRKFSFPLIKQTWVRQSAKSLLIDQGQSCFRPCRCHRCRRRQRQTCIKIWVWDFRSELIV